MKEYEKFLIEFDKKIASYFDGHKEFILCRKGCSECCKCGDYPLTQLELGYVMKGYAELTDELKQIVQKNFNTILPGGVCPFLVNDICSVYKYRPIICRVHGLAYVCTSKKAVLPYCANTGKNYSAVYADGRIDISPIMKNLDTPEVLKDFDFGEIRKLYDWFKAS